MKTNVSRLTAALMITLLIFNKHKNTDHKAGVSCVVLYVNPPVISPVSIFTLPFSRGPPPLQDSNHELCAVLKFGR